MTLSVPAIIQQKYGSLSELHKKIADALLDDSHQIAFLSITELSKRVGASEATLTRFSRALGFKGYSDMQGALQEELRLNLTPQEKMRQTLEKYGGDRENPLQSIWREEAEKVKMAYQLLDEVRFQQAVDAIVRTRKIVLVGLGISASLVDFLQFRFRRMGFEVAALTGGGSGVLENITSLKPEDTLIAIGFFRMYPEVLAALDFAKKVGASSIGITEGQQTTIAAKADIVLLASRGPVNQLNSLAVPMVLAHSLAMNVALRRKEEVLEVMDNLKWMSHSILTNQDRGETIQ